MITIRVLGEDDSNRKTFAQIINNFFEAEDGAVSGNVPVVNDPNASNGKYILLGSADPGGQSQCSGATAPPHAAAAGISKLAFCDDFSTDTVARGETTEARDITDGKKWTTERATGWGGTPDPASAFNFNNDGTLTVQPIHGTYNWFMSSTVSRNGTLKGFWLAKEPSWYVEIRWKFEEGTSTERQPGFWSMDTCHLYGLPAKCPTANQEFIEPDFWEYVTGNSMGLHYYHETKNPQGQHSCGGGHLNPPGENTWFVAGHLFDRDKQLFVKDDEVYYTRNANENCASGKPPIDAGFIFEKMLSGDYPILVGSKPGEIITIDYVRVWVKP